MDERDAKLQGLKIHRREMAFIRGFVTCTNCGACYDQNNDPTFCQMYSRTVDPAATEQNIFVAEACDQWVAQGLDRNKVVHPAHAYRYENWILCADRMPPEYQTVIVGRPDVPWPITAFWNGEKWCRDVMNDTFHVTHWMPMPLPPSNA